MFGSAYWWEGEMTQESKSPESLLKTIKDNKVEHDRPQIYRYSRSLAAFLGAAPRSRP